MKKIKTKGSFETTAHRVISREAGEIICMPDEDYEEVKELCEVIEMKIKRIKEGGMQKGGDNGLPVNPPPENLRPQSPPPKFKK